MNLRTCSIDVLMDSVLGPLILEKAFAGKITEDDIVKVIHFKLADNYRNTGLMMEVNDPTFPFVAVGAIRAVSLDTMETYIQYIHHVSFHKHEPDMLVAVEQSALVKCVLAIEE